MKIRIMALGPTPSLLTRNNCSFQRGQLGNSPHKFVWYNRRHDEYELHNNKGGYIRIMDKNAVGRPCPECGGEVEKIQYLGGECYFCPNCQE